MDETTAQSNANDTPLAQNEYVRELFTILQDHGRDTTGLSALIGHVSEMENFVKRAEEKITDMKSQLAEMKEAQNHPVKTALQKAIKSLENTVAVMKEQIRDLKNSIIDSCKHAVQAFKERGVSALDKLATFFHIKGAFKAIDKTAQANIAVCDKGIAHQAAYYAEFYKASRAVRNMGRILIGKEPLPSQSETRRLEKAAIAPFRAEKAINEKISELANAAVKSLARLAATAKDSRDHRAIEKQPKLLDELRDAQQLVTERKLEMPVPERVRANGAVEV
jgi:polyhydroxyalkanoate synthesis regulator phasin